MLLQTEKLKVCPGHPDKQFVCMVNEKKERKIAQGNCCIHRQRKCVDCNNVQKQLAAPY